MQNITSGHLEKMQVTLPDAGSSAVNYGLRLDVPCLHVNSAQGIKQFHNGADGGIEMKAVFDILGHFVYGLMGFAV